MITAGSLFTGVGGFDLAARRVGMRVLWQAEIDKQAQSVLMRHFPECSQLGDVRNVNRANAATPDVLVGGSPCQDISKSGSRKGLAGDKSKLFWEQIRVIEELRPAVAIWENVENALACNAGRDFLMVLRAFQQCGARDITWRVFDSQYAGVPQRRKRVFLVADFRAERAAEILFERSGAYGDSPPRKKTRHDIAHTLTARNQRDGVQNKQTYIPTITYPITTNYHATDATRQTYVPTRIQSETPRVSGTLAASGSGTARASGQRNEFDFVIPDESEFGVRRLMPIECERLQGFPDNYTRWGHDGREMSDTARYRMMGNAVTVNVVEWILRRVAIFAAAVASKPA